jgi:hypothetical protein
MRSRHLRRTVLSTGRSSGSEFTIKVATIQGDSEEIAPTLNVKFWVLVVVACSTFSGTAEPNLLGLFEPLRTISNLVRKDLARES